MEVIGGKAAPASEGRIARYSDARVDDLLGDEPPLGFSPQSDIRLDRFAVGVRWYAAITLTAMIAAALMVGALYTALGRGVRVAKTPVMLRPIAAPQTDVAEGRADRIGRRGPAAKQASAQTRVDQLSASGSSIAHFTYFVADLAHVMDAPATAVPVAPSDHNEETSGERHDENEAETLLDAAQRLMPARPDAPASVETHRAAGRPALGEPLNVTAVAKTGHDQPEPERVIIAKAGDKLASILQALGAESDNAEEIASQFPNLPGGASGTFAGGERVAVLQGASMEAAGGARVLKVSVEPLGASSVAVALADDGRYLRVAAPRGDDGAGSARLADAGDDVGAAAGSGESLRDTLYDMADRSRIDRTLVDDFARVCQHDFDLGAPVSNGDKVEFLYRPDDADGPRLVFAKLTVEGKTQAYYQFTSPDDGSVDYYDDAGHSVTKFLLRKPVAAGRLGDGFGWRIHPVLGDRRFHEGVRLRRAIRRSDRRGGRGRGRQNRFGIGLWQIHPHPA